MRQAIAAGYSSEAIWRRVRNGSLVRIHPRIYGVAGAPRTAEQRALAAVLWAGGGAVVSHDTAAALWGLVIRSGGVDVTVERQKTAPPSGIRVHTSLLPRRDRGRLRGVPVAGVGRTLLDLTGHRNDDELLPIVERAVLGGLVTSDQVNDLLGRNRGRRGCRRLARCLDSAGSSALERTVEAVLREAGLPPHEREFPAGRFRLDFAWPDRRVAIEADGRRWHSSARDFARDRAKHNYLIDNGWRVLRVTGRDLADPAPLLSTLVRLLTGGV